MIAAFAGPRVFKYLGGARSDSARIQIENLSAGVDLYRLEVGTYPPDLEALVNQPSGVDNWNGPYLKKRAVPKDPWGNDYLYRLPGEHGPYDLLSLGADNADGGDGEDRDIVSWE
jgi:general secretion pathway protein G